MTTEQANQKNSDRFPFAAKVRDELREVFGPGVQVEYAEENGHVFGTKGPDGVRPVIEKRQAK